MRLLIALVVVITILILYNQLYRKRRTALSNRTSCKEYSVAKPSCGEHVALSTPSSLDDDDLVIVLNSRTDSIMYSNKYNAVISKNGCAKMEITPYGELLTRMNGIIIQRINKSALERIEQQVEHITSNAIDGAMEHLAGKSNSGRSTIASQYYSLSLQTNGCLVIHDDQGLIRWSSGYLSSPPNSRCCINHEYTLKLSNTGSLFLIGGLTGQRTTAVELVLPSMRKDKPDIIISNDNILWSSVSMMNSIRSDGRSHIKSADGSKSLNILANGNLTINDITGNHPLQIHETGTDSIVRRHELTGPYYFTLHTNGNMVLSQAGKSPIYQTGPISTTRANYKALLTNKGTLRILRDDITVREITLILHYL